MNVILSVACLVVAVAMFMFLVVATKDRNISPSGFLFCFFVGLFFSIFSLAFMHDAGMGKLPYDFIPTQKLSVGEVREVICTAKTKRGLIGALLRRPDGELEARALYRDPPKRFVREVEDDGDPSYAPYPKE